MIDPVSQKTATLLPQATNDRKKEQDLMEKILLEEVKQLQAQVISTTSKRLACELLYPSSKGFYCFYSMLEIFYSLETYGDLALKQVTTLAEECRHKSLKVQLYKRELEETWLVVRDEATKCKAAKDIIKILTNQV
jgi:hypothetical protein